MESDPLNIGTPRIQNHYNNKRGRPVSTDIIRFGPQSKSTIIAEIINKKNAKLFGLDSEPEPMNECSKSRTENKTCELFSETCLKRIKEPKRCLRTHITSTVFTCDYPNCSYSCKLSCNLIKHKRVHTSEKPYICDQCPFRTSFVNSLKAHKRIHTVERPYACQYCKYRCNSSSNLKKHCRHRHPEKLST